MRTNSRVIGYSFKRSSAATKFFVCGYLACDSVFGFLFSSLWWFVCDLIILFTIITRTATTTTTTRAITTKYYKLYWQLVMQFYFWNFSLPIFSFLFQLEDMVDSFWWSLFVTDFVVAVIAVGRLSLFLSKKKKQNKTKILWQPVYNLLICYHSLNSIVRNMWMWREEIRYNCPIKKTRILCEILGKGIGFQNRNWKRSEDQYCGFLKSIS